MAKGLEKGIEKGVEKGVEKGIEKVAKSLLSLGLSAEQIKSAAGLNDEQIKGL